MPSTINSTTTAGVAVSGDNSGVLALQTNNGTTAVTIDTSQNVGVGTTSPSSFAGKLVVNGGVSLLNSNRLYLWSPSNGFAPAIYAPSESIAFTDNNGVETFRVGSTGVLTLKGGNNAASGVGITFPATQSASSDANTLDDYEEGTWTPTIGASTTLPTSVTYVTQTGRYTKIGRMVSIQGRLQISAISGGVGNFAINGLPFANSANIVGAGLSWFSAVNLSAGYTTAGLYFAGNDAFLSLAESGDNVGANQLSIGTIGATFDIAFAFTYQV